MVRSLLLVGAVVVLVELVVRLFDFRLPGLVIYPTILYASFHWGMRAGVAASLLGVGYILAGIFLLGRPLGPPDHDRWRIGIVATGIPAAALAIGLLRDRFDALLAQERAARAAVRAEREHTARILERITDGVIELDPSWRITYANRVAEELLRLTRDELIGMDVREHVPDVKRSVFYRHYERALQEQVPVHFEAASGMTDAWLDVHAYPSSAGLTIFFRDVTDRHQHEERLRSLSMVDELTGLYNRRGFFTLANQQCRHAERKRRGLLLVFIDLDGLKRINDTLGHVAGDQAIVALAGALRHSFRESDVLARLGGDEFAALALEADAGVAPIPLRRLMEAIEEFNRGGALSLPLSVSIGTAFFDPDHPRSVDDLLAIADGRMYARKREKKNGSYEL